MTEGLTTRGNISPGNQDISLESQFVSGNLSTVVCFHASKGNVIFRTVGLLISGLIYLILALRDRRVTLRASM